MAIATVVTSGFGNGTLSGTIPLVVTRGYSIAVPIVGGTTWHDDVILSRQSWGAVVLSTESNEDVTLSRESNDDVTFE